MIAKENLPFLGATRRERAMWTVGYAVSAVLMFLGLWVWAFVTVLIALGWATTGLISASRKIRCPWGSGP